ncbi:MAG: 50S ribosomal protein L10 [Christensenellaceae bacterium]|nr:50S ribosomal protein L10 [Christensenellaceae bacterium]
MGKNLDIKKQVVADITEKFQNAKSVIAVKYSGLTVEQATDLRAKFRAEGVDYCVLKNTLVKRAANKLNITSLDEYLEGPSAFAFGMTDAVAPARIISEFIKKDKSNALEIKAGLLDNEFMDVAEIQKLASLPSREVLLARLLGSLNGTIASFARVLEAIRKQKAGEDEPAA